MRLDFSWKWLWQLTLEDQKIPSHLLQNRGVDLDSLRNTIHTSCAYLYHWLLIHIARLQNQNDPLIVKE
jgi:hypothetical protein